MKKSLKLILGLIASIMMFTYGNISYANYQSSGQTNYYTNSTNFIKGIRSMEASGQVIGLEESYNNSTLKATTESNNIDVHMIKGTEYGAIALLSASQDYGKTGTGRNRYVVSGSGLATTTGNVYGIYVATGQTNTWTAAGGIDFIDANIDSRYINRYSNNEKKSGDAILNWHERNGASYFNGSTQSGYRRGYQGLFEASLWHYSYGNASRAVAVCGQGF